eukprot:CAMPEP_0170545322 /NCGR_PEP_ID=MMETSP0211-20121228/3747_1 /TAXON_ID=311385 /ORGANISM="Pseudokeronopsis sp., Strain OXSARD2" /LENGTH=130 /DNA_ID=CAMNT_0010849185 /DNA_START=105 /DNA_END=497 /DNA_ORIENTATION=+
MTVYKQGDYVDVVADSSIHKGMPHKYYHGKTGRVWDVTPTAIGVVINKKVNGRIIPKKLHVRIEHVRKSQCREAFKRRVRENDAKKVQAKKDGVRLNLKRVPVLPRESHEVDVSKTKIEYMNPIKFRYLF